MLNTNRKIILFGTPILLYLFLVFNGWLGIRFGWHWDEWNFINLACESSFHNDYLPHKYIYPSFCYYISLFAAFIYRNINSINDLNTLLADYNFVVFVRFLFMLISSLTVIWTFFCTYLITKKYWISLLSGLVVCSSFEFSYHSRWAVSDCIVAQFAFLSTFILFLDLNLYKKIIFSAVVVGIAAGTKYTAGFVGINILFYVIYNAIDKHQTLKTTARQIGLMLLFGFIGFVVTTPGIVLETSKFVDGLIFQKDVYSNWFYGYTVSAGYKHLLRILEYMLFALFSKISLISIFVTLFAIIGIIYLIIKKQWNYFVLFLAIAVYIIFVSRFKVMIVRNLIYILPFFAVLFSVGIDWVVSKIRIEITKRTFIAVIFIVLGFSCSSVVIASMNVHNKDKINLAAELNAYISRNKTNKLYFSPQVLALTNGQQNADSLNKSNYLLFFKDELPWQKYKANVHNQFEEIIGIDDVNINYYPTWSGDDRIIVIKYKKASENILSIFK